MLALMSITFFSFAIEHYVINIAFSISTYFIRHGDLRMVSKPIFVLSIRNLKFHVPGHQVSRCIQKKILDQIHVAITRMVDPSASIQSAMLQRMLSWLKLGATS